MTAEAPCDPPRIQCPNCGRFVEMIWFATPEGWAYPIHTTVEPTYLWDFAYNLCPNGSNAVAMAVDASRSQQ
jgi:hypothetical protein